MSEEKNRILNCFAEAFMQDRMEFLSNFFAYPQPVFLRGELQVFGAADTFIEALRLYRAAAMEIGTVTLRPRIVADGLTVRGYGSVWVEWDHLDADGTCLRTNQVRYATYQDAGALYPRIEMIDYTVTAFPEALNATQQVAIA
ncbi:hypothetical protein [Tateyamaria sp. SN6-1]|uniref:hypothetical protein n=1 Tax=Tateyamaria sp. SN6-1 TaxID=3092148 RepID=UPI0039F5B251